MTQKNDTEIYTEDELFDICDEEGNPTGKTVPRKVAHAEGICHRTAHIWVIRNERKAFAEILLQKRTMEKDSFPGCYDTSSAGHVKAGFEPAESAVREMKEELGIDASVQDLVLIGTFKNKYESEFHGKIFKDNEITSVYVYNKPVDTENLQLQKEEVESVKWFDLDYIYSQKLIHNKQFCLTLTGLRILMDYLDKLPE